MSVGRVSWIVRVKKSQDEPRCKEGSLHVCMYIYICRDGDGTCGLLSNVHAYRRTRRIQVVHYYCGSSQAVDAVNNLVARWLVLDDHGQYVTGRCDS